MSASADCQNLTANMIGKVVSCVQSTVSQELIKRQDYLVAEGQDLAAVFLLIAMSLALIDAVLSGDGASAIADGIHALMRYFLVVVLLTGWSSTVGDFFNSNMNAVAQKVAGVDTVASSMDLMFKSLVSLAGAEEIMGDNCYTTPPGVDDTIPKVVCDKPPGVKDSALSIWDVIAHLPRILFQMLIKSAAAFFVVLMMIVYVTGIVMAQAMFAIGMCLGPILVAGLVWKRTEFLFDGFLRFMLKASLTKIVAALMVATVTGVILIANNMAKLIDTGGAVGRIDLVAAFMVMVVAAVGAYLMHNVESIAGALVSGSGSPGAGRLLSGAVRSVRAVRR